MGVYGYRFMDGGKHATTVFRSRGYTTMIPDKANTLLFMVGLSVGLMSALYFAIMIVFNWDARDRYSLLPASLQAPFVLGTMLSVTFSSMIGVAVKAVVLCFLESPDEFQKNHPQLYELMNDAWLRECSGHTDQYTLSSGPH